MNGDQKMNEKVPDSEHRNPPPAPPEEGRKRKIIPYNPKLKERARYLRNHSTKTEITLWKYLKGKQLNGYDFDRQKPIDQFIVDFYCKNLRLAIELDGESHVEKWGTYDVYRDRRLQEFGITVLHFQNEEILKHTRDVLMTIEEAVKKLEKEHDRNE